MSENVSQFVVDVRGVISYHLMILYMFPTKKNDIVYVTEIVMVL
jgi:hypothetical protein